MFAQIQAQTCANMLGVNLFAHVCAYLRMFALWYISLRMFVQVCAMKPCLRRFIAFAQCLTPCGAAGLARAGEGGLARAGDTRALQRLC